MEDYAHETFPLSEHQLVSIERMIGDDPKVFESDTTEYIYMWGMRAGKDSIAKWYCTYSMYRLLCLHDPLSYFKTDSLQIVNVSAVNEVQSRFAFFERLKSGLLSTTNPKTGRNWFEEQGVDTRSGCGDVQSKIIKLPHNISAMTFGTKETAPEGINIFIGIMDEPSRAARSETEYEKVKKMFSLLKTNIGMTFGEQGRLILISYPCALTFDLTVDRYEAAKTDPHIYAEKLATPEVRYISQKTLDMLAESVEDFECRVMCVIPAAVGAVIPDKEKIAQAFDINNKFIADYAPVIREGLSGQEYVALERVEWFGADKQLYFAHLDYGKTNASTALVVGHPVDVEYAGEDGAVTFERHTIIDLILEWQPRKAGSRHIYADNLDVESTIVKLATELPLHKLSSDRWNSDHTLLELEAICECEALTFSQVQQVGEAKLLRKIIYNNRIKIPIHARAQDQLKHTRLVNNCRIECGKGFKKDIFDCIARVNAECQRTDLGLSYDLFIAPTESDQFTLEFSRAEPDYSMAGGDAW